MNREPPLARPLFTSRLLHESSQLRRRALRRQTNRAPHILGLICYSVVLLAAMLLPVALNDSHHNLLTGITNLIDEVIPQFLSSYPMNNSTLPSWVDYRGQYLMGVANARSFSLIVGILLSLMTYFCVYYNSEVPGEYPRSPFSPQKNSRYQCMQSNSDSNSGLALSYKMVPINGVVFALTTLVFLRLYLNVPF